MDTPLKWYRSKRPPKKGLDPLFGLDSVGFRVRFRSNFSHWDSFLLGPNKGSYSCTACLLVILWHSQPFPWLNRRRGENGAQSDGQIPIGGLLFVRHMHLTWMCGNYRPFGSLLYTCLWWLEALTSLVIWNVFAIVHPGRSSSRLIAFFSLEGGGSTTNLTTRINMASQKKSIPFPICLAKFNLTSNFLS